MSIDATNFAWFLMASALVVLMPGPNVLCVLTRGITNGKDAAVVSALGASAGDFCYAVMTALGLSVLLQTSATAYSIIKITGAAYLMYIGIQSFLKGENLLAPAAPNLEVQERGKLRIFAKGFLTSALNPKTAIFFVSFFPQFINPQSGSVTTTMFFYGLMFTLLGLVVMLFYAYAATAIRQWLTSHQGMEKYFSWLTGSLFVGLGLRLALSEEK